MYLCIGISDWPCAKIALTFYPLIHTKIWKNMQSPLNMWVNVCVYCCYGPFRDYLMQMGTECRFTVSVPLCCRHCSEEEMSENVKLCINSVSNICTVSPYCRGAEAVARWFFRHWGRCPGFYSCLGHMGNSLQAVTSCRVWQPATGCDDRPNYDTDM